MTYFDTFAYDLIIELPHLFWNCICSLFILHLCYPSKFYLIHSNIVFFASIRIASSLPSLFSSCVLFNLLDFFPISESLSSIGSNNISDDLKGRIDKLVNNDRSALVKEVIQPVTVTPFHQFQNLLILIFSV